MEKKSSGGIYREIKRTKTILTTKKKMLEKYLFLEKGTFALFFLLPFVFECVLFLLPALKLEIYRKIHYHPRGAYFLFFVFLFFFFLVKKEKKF